MTTDSFDPAAVEHGRRQGLAYAQEIHEICRIAGQPDACAKAFIAANASAAEVRRELVAALPDAPTITGRRSLADGMKARQAQALSSPAAVAQPFKASATSQGPRRSIAERMRDRTS